MDYRIEVITAADWRALKALRLEMLRDTPNAYGETLPAAEGQDNAEWQFRAGRSAGPGNVALAARDLELDDWVAMMGGFVDDAGRAVLYGVYVRPSHRGRHAGIADALLDGVEDWARTLGHGELVLHVHEENPRAQAFYARRGYQFTGHREPYRLNPAETELEMQRSLGNKTANPATG